MKPSKVILMGAGGHGSEICAYMHDLGQSVFAVLDDNVAPGKWNGSVVAGNIAFIRELALQHRNETLYYITAFGDNSVRKKMVERIESFALANIKPASVIHSMTFVGHGSQIGNGCLLAPGAIVTTNAVIGDHCILNMKASVGHDCQIGAFTNLNPGCTIAGNCRIGNGSYIGAGATVIQKIQIGEGAIVGAGAVVHRDVPAFTTVVGVPARVIKSRSLQHSVGAG